MTKELAQLLASRDRSYRAKKLRGSDEWIVWQDEADAEVEYSHSFIAMMANATLAPYDKR